MWGFNGTVVPAWLAEFETRFGLGGVILFDYDVQKKKYENNIISPTQVASLCRELSALSSRPLIMVDQEGGKVRRLKEKLGFAPLPSAQSFNLLPRAEKKAQLEKSFSQMRDLGFHFDLTPVVDLNTNPKNPDIGAVERSFSADEGEVRANVALINEVASAVGLGLCLKHFPGLGGATTNSHLELTDISASLSQTQIDLFFELLPKISGGAMLLSHGIVKQWEPKLPVSLSAKVVSEIRGKVRDALLMTDDLQMQGLQVLFHTEAAVIKAVAAGVDMVIIGNNLLNEEAEKAFAIAEALQRAMEKDENIRENVRKSVGRVGKRKAEFGVGGGKSGTN